MNDPSTAVTCIDHLGRVLCRLARRHLPGPCVREEGSGRLLVARRAPSFAGALDLAFNQLRQYGCGDMAVALRILRALTEIAEATRDERALRRVRHHADLLEAGLDARFLEADRSEFTARLELLRARA